MYLLRLLNIYSICLVTDTLKGSGIQEKKNALNIARIFDVPLTSHDS